MFIRGSSEGKAIPTHIAVLSLMLLVGYHGSKSAMPFNGSDLVNIKGGGEGGAVTSLPQ